MKVLELLTEIDRANDIYQRIKAGQISPLETEYVSRIKQLLYDTQHFYNNKSSSTTEQLTQLLAGVNKQIAYLRRLISKIGVKSISIMKHTVNNSDVSPNIKSVILNKFKPELYHAQVLK